MLRALSSLNKAARYVPSGEIDLGQCGAPMARDDCGEAGRFVRRTRAAACERNSEADVHWDLGLPLLIMLATLIAMGGIAVIVKKMLLDPRHAEGRD